MDLARLYDQHALASFDRRTRLRDLVGAAAPWSFSADDGMVRLRGWRFAAHLIGTESDADGSWRWAWSHGASQTPPAVLGSAERLRAWGGRHGVAAFIAARQALTEVDGERIGAIACGVLGAPAWHIAPCAGGRLVLLIVEPLPTLSATNPVRAVGVIGDGIAALPIRDHRRAILAYLAWLRWRIDLHAHRVEAHDALGQRLVAAFDAQGRLARCSALVGATCQP